MVKLAPKIFSLLVLVVFISFLQTKILGQNNNREVILTQYIIRSLDKDGACNKSYKHLGIASTNAKLKFSTQAKDLIDLPSGTNKSVVLIVDPAIETGIRDSITQFTTELSLDGYNVIKHILAETSPDELRSYLHNTYQNTTPPLVGAILIGDIPKPFFRFYYPASSGCLERGPTECISFQFYQDLDGIFSCSDPESCDHPGCYDTHSGSIDSEIWVSVLPFYLDQVTTVDRISRYFLKNHEYRIGLMRSGPGYVDPLIGSRIDTHEQYQSQVDYVLNSEWAWKPLTTRGNILVGPDNSLGDPINYPNAAYCYEQAMLTDKYDFANIGAHGSCTEFGMTGGSIYIDVHWANTHDIKPHFLWDHSCNTGNIDCQPNLASTFLYNPDNYVILVKAATSPQGGLGVSVVGGSYPTIGWHLSQGWSFGEAILTHINTEFEDCYAQQREYFVAQYILLGDGTLKLPEYMPQIIQYSLVISSSAGGTTDPSPGNYTYNEGTEVKVTATPNTGYIFVAWSGDVTSSVNPVTITMDSNKSITANFTKESGGGDGGGVCFIATACYGTPLAEEVKILCSFRDQYLLTNPLGKVLVKIYCLHSPKVADFIRDKENLKAVVRECLKPIVKIMSWVVK